MDGGGDDGSGWFGDRVMYPVDSDVALDLTAGVGVSADDGADVVQRVENATTGGGEDRITGTWGPTISTPARETT